MWCEPLHLTQRDWSAQDLCMWPYLWQFVHWGGPLYFRRGSVIYYLIKDKDNTIYRRNLRMINKRYDNMNESKNGTSIESTLRPKSEHNIGPCSKLHFLHKYLLFLTLFIFLKLPWCFSTFKFLLTLASILLHGWDRERRFYITLCAGCI